MMAALEARYERLFRFPMLASAFSVCVLAAALPDYAETRSLLLPWPPASLFILLVFGTAISSILVFRRIPADGVTQALFLWTAGYLLLWGYGFGLEGFSPNPVVLKALKDRIYAIMIIWGVYILARDRFGRRAIALALMAALVIDQAAVLYEMANPGRFTQVYGRAAGYFQNPTITGQALAAILLGTWDDLPEKAKGPVFLTIGVCIFGTFSRGSMVGWVLLWIGGLALGLWNIRRTWPLHLVILGLILALVVLIGSGVLEGLQWGALNENTLNRMQFGGNQSSSDRAMIAQRAWEEVQRAPWLGHGILSSERLGHIGTHNLHLAMWYDLGILGLTALPLLMLPLWGGSPSGRLFFLYFLYFGFFCHNTLEERNFLIPFALMLARTSQPLHSRESIWS